MAQVGVLRTVEGGSVSFHCPGCKSMHVVRVAPTGNAPCWQFNGDHEKPTLSPSVFIRWGHHVPGYDKGSGQYCQFGCDDPKESPTCCGVCHSFVRDGQIQFLSDCTHALAGQTVPLTPRDPL